MEKVLNLAVVGFGLRAEYMVKNFKEFQMPAQVTAIVDPDKEGVLARLKTLGIAENSVTFYENMDDMVKKSTPDGLMISTRCNLHTPLACQAMAYGVPLFLEKPVAISQEQLHQLSQAEATHQPTALVSFPLRVTPLVQEAKKIVDSGVLGKICQVQMINNVNYGRVYYHSWYQDDAMTGGLFLQKSTHDLDLLHHLLGEYPSVVSAMESHKIFQGEHDHQATCPTCPEYRTCPESTHVIRTKYFEEITDEGCAFQKNRGNHDGGSMILSFPSGIHATYSQNFVVRKASAQRSTRIIGYEATLEFDFVTSKIRVMHHNRDINQEIIVDTTGQNHFGGDKILAENLVSLMEGSKNSMADLKSGIESCRTCLMAKESAQTSQFVSR